MNNATGGKLPTRWINNTPIPDDYTFPSLTPIPQPIGWQCPICGQVYAPYVMTCFKKHRKPRKPKAVKE